MLRSACNLTQALATRPAQGVAMVSQLLADGGGPLYRAGSREDLDTVIQRASQVLTR